MRTRTYNHSVYWHAKRHAINAHGKHCRRMGDEADARWIAMEEERARREMSLLRCGPWWIEHNICIFHLAYLVAVELGGMMAKAITELPEGEKRTRAVESIRKMVNSARRPDYYEKERQRRRELAAERRKIRRRSTTAEMPSPNQILEAWNRRRESTEWMMRLGGLLHDLECHVDNNLKIDGRGRIVGRKGGIKEWLFDNLPELHEHYKTLMRYKAMVKKLRQATKTTDPTPTSELLIAERKHKIVEEILHPRVRTFSRVVFVLNNYVSPDRAYLDENGRPDVFHRLLMRRQRE